MFVLCFILAVSFHKECNAPVSEAICTQQLADWVNRSVAYRREQKELPFRTAAACSRVR